MDAEKDTLEKRNKTRKKESPVLRRGNLCEESSVREVSTARSAKASHYHWSFTQARRAGVDLPPPEKGSKETRKQAASDLKKGKKKSAKKSAKRSQAASRALKREGRSAASQRALSRQAHSAARKRSAAARSRSAKKAAQTRKKQS
jgi:hypothetical protein